MIIFFINNYNKNKLSFDEHKLKLFKIKLFKLIKIKYYIC